MPVYASGSIRFDGLGSDTNFSEMIDKLYKIESRQVTQLLRWKDDWQRRMDGFDQVRTALQEMQTALTQLNTMNKFMAKVASSSDEKVASATAFAGSTDGAYSLEVKQLATNSTWSVNSGVYSAKESICDTAGGGSITYSYAGKTRTLSVPKGTSLEGLVSLVNRDSKNAGVTAQLVNGKNGVEFMLSGKNTGEANSLVIRETTNLKGLEVNLAQGNYDDSQENRMQLLSGFDPSDPDSMIVNPADGTDKTFVYNVDGKQYNVNVAPGTSIDEVCNLINAQHPSPSGYTLPPLASLQPKVPSDGLLYFTIEKPDTDYIIAGKDTETQDILSATYATPETKLNEGGTTDQILTFTINTSDGSSKEEEIEVTVTPDMTVNELTKAIQKKVGSKAEVKLSQDGGGEWQIDIQQKPKTHRVVVGKGSLDSLKYEIPKDSRWNITEGVDAQVKINGWPSGDDTWFETSSNTLEADVVWPGITFKLRDVGKTVITTSTDKAKIEENVMAFCDAVNNVRTVLNYLTKVDDEKETLDSDYAVSQFEMQKGSVLTGNYGIQLITSKLKTAVGSSAVGFRPAQYGSDGAFLSGDIFNSLSQIGITTVADQGNALYGLLDINFTEGQYGSLTLKEAIDKDPEAVCKLFAAENQGYSDSTHFRYNSHLAKITKHGNYEISYTADDDGNIIKATINGKEAKYNPETQQITAMEGDARGLMVDVVVIEPGTTQTGTVSIQQGKVSEVLGLLEGSEGMLGTSGTLKNLERNYKDIMDNIEKKIKQEDERLAKWERTMINKFARLEKVLAQYNAMNDGLQSQLASLKSNSSNS
ncbi:flagellar filament capping protein FliD [Desulfovibrio sp. OttesenSCG-928-G15]|nr:flagellar filament capping protein FliD [Desulfovibrio sp. OttesenSCG-928-G15]